ncbi:MAG: hypothetical protein AAGD11_15000 [Planctomycetota bacterium]
MARNTTRTGRRRRVLNEEVLSASNITAYTGKGDSNVEPGDTPRYGAGANIENHPQVTSFVPRRFRTLCLFGLAGISVAVVAELIAYYAQPLSDLAKVVSPAELTDALSNRPIAWMSATVLLLTVGYARLVFSLRRHRVDDYRGRYRVWRTAGWAATLLSINAVVALHPLIARYLGSLVEWQLLPEGAGWWLVPVTLAGGWLMIKVMIEAAECKAALALYLLASVCLAVSGAHSAGWSPNWAAALPEVMSRSLPLVGFTFLLVGSQLFARYVILDVQGLIEHSAPIAEQPNEASKVGERAPSNQQPVPSIEEDEPATQSSWVDGSEPETDYEEQPTRRLSKAERKRLRKQKSRNRAA